jgi:transposase
LKEGEARLWDIIGFGTSETLPDDIATLQRALAAERAARQQAEARASGAEAMVAHLKLLIATMKREAHARASP